MDEVSGIERQAREGGTKDEAAALRRLSSSSRFSSVLFWLVQVSRYGLAALWLFAAGAKLYMRNDPAESFFTNMPFLVGERWAMTVAVAVICSEILAALLLLWPRTARTGGIWSATLLAGFAGYALYYRYGLGNAEGLECGCFGRIFGSQLGVSTALRNLLLLIPAAFVIFGIKNAKVRRKPFD
jgi:hypothetical protein